jgi:hypothetical protein
VKDKFSIHVIDDLLDELSGSQLFTKLVLHSSYHHIRMKEVDIPKTTFRSHEGHYVFFIIPFILCDAPSNLQIILNYGLCPFLCQFFLVFFDDILIYSKSWQAHLAHVDQVLHLLSQHKCFLK